MEKKTKKSTQIKFVLADCVGKIERMIGKKTMEEIDWMGKLADTNMILEEKGLQ